MEATVIYSIAAFYKWVLIYSFKVSSEEPPRRDWRPSLKGQALLNLVMCSGSCCPRSPRKEKHYNFFVATEGGQPVGFTSAIFSPMHLAISLSLPSPYFDSGFSVILEPERHLPCWHFIIHNGLIHVDISWRSFSSYGFLSPLMGLHMATSGNCTYPNWLADIINCFLSSSLMENRHVWPPHSTAALWCRDGGYYNRGPKMWFQQSAQTSFELWISSPQRERGNDFLAVVLSRPADAIQPRSLITHPDTETHTHVGDAYSTLCRCTHTHGGGGSCSTTLVQSWCIFILLTVAQTASCMRHAAWHKCRVQSPAGFLECPQMAAASACECTSCE